MLRNKFACRSGISILETTIALGMLVGVALTSSYFITSTNNIKNKTEVKASIDQIHIIQVQRARNSDQIKKAVLANITAGATRDNFMNCFNGSSEGSNCNSVAASSIPNTLAEAKADANTDGTPDGLLAEFANTSFKMFGEANLFESTAYWYAVCPNAERCTSIEVQIVTQVRPGSSMNQKLDPRVTVLTFPPQFFADQTRIRFTCTGNGAAFPGPIAYGLDTTKNRADCREDVYFVADATYVTCATSYPMRNFGSVTAAPGDRCNPPSIADCSASRGYRQVGFTVSECRTRP